MQKLGMTLVAALAMLSAIGCDDGAIDKSEQAIKCQNICDRVDDCTGKDNSTSCRKECVDKSTDDDFEAQADKCYDCVDKDNSCTENVVNCSTECASVVVLSR